MNVIGKVKNNSNVLGRISSFYKKLSPSERKVADFVLANSQQIIHMPMSEIARQTSVSDPSVLRFCRSLGYHGYLDFKLALTQDLATPTEFINETVNEDDSVSEIAQKIFSAGSQALFDTLQGLDLLELEQTINLIKDANFVLITGVGTSAPIAQMFFNRLLRLGINARIQTDSYLQLMEASLLGPDDLVIAISQTGASIDPIITLDEAKEHGAKTIAITGTLASPVTESADVSLFSSSTDLRPESASSRISQIVILETIYVALSLKCIKKSQNNEQKLWSALVKKTL